MSRVPLMLLAVPCLWSARWEQSPDAFDMSCVRWSRWWDAGTKPLQWKGTGLERSYCTEHLLEEEVSTRSGLIAHFWHVSWGQHRAANAAVQQLACRAGTALWLPAHILKGRRERKPLQLGWVQAATSSCLEAFLTAVRSLNCASWCFKRKTSPPFLTLFNHKSVSFAAGWSSLQHSAPSSSGADWGERGGGWGNQTFSIPSFPGATGLPVQNCYITLMAAASGIAITTSCVSSPGSWKGLL